MLDLLPVLEGATETSVTSSDRFVPGRVESGSARPLTGKSSMLKLKRKFSAESKRRNESAEMLKAVKNKRAEERGGGDPV